jgi:hypothetical protein
LVPRVFNVDRKKSVGWGWKGYAELLTQQAVAKLNKGKFLDTRDLLARDIICKCWHEKYDIAADVEKNLRLGRVTTQDLPATNLLAINLSIGHRLESMTLRLKLTALYPVCCEIK